MKKKQVATLSLMLLLGLAGGTLIKISLASAQSQSPTTNNVSGGHVGANGVREELLTGDTAEKVRAAALAAVPEGTIERLETDAEGSPYEAHMVTPDGSRVTVKFDSNFAATNIETNTQKPLQTQ